MQPAIWSMAAVLVLVTASTTSAATFLVRPDGTGDFATLQDAIVGVSDGDVIELANGVFVGPGNREVDYLGKSIEIRSRSGDPTLCTIDCEGAGRGFLFVSGEGADAVLRGVTITGGTRGGGCSTGCGGALRCDRNASPTIVDVRFVGNVVTGTADGGAVYCSGGAAPTFLRCTFIENLAADDGGAILVYSASAILDACVFVANACLGEGTPSGGAGGAVGGDFSTTLDIRRCTFYGNAGPHGGAIGVKRGARATITASIAAFSVMGEGVLVGTSSSATLDCTDIFGNAGGDWVDGVADQLGVMGNFSADPRFCDPVLHDFTLFVDSPCLPGHHPDGVDCGLIGALGQGCGATPVLGVTWGALKGSYR